MSNFTLDTSGAVDLAPPGPLLRPGCIQTLWPDLSPFEQGYVEAMFAIPRDGWKWQAGKLVSPGFADLAPETLAAIRKDCALYIREYARSGAVASGTDLWRVRQEGRLGPAFRPLTVTLGDDGRVYLREAGR